MRLHRIASYSQPLGAEQVYAAVQQADTEPGRATVYRTYDLLLRRRGLARCKLDGTKGDFMTRWRPRRRSGRNANCRALPYTGDARHQPGP